MNVSRQDEHSDTSAFWGTVLIVLLVLVALIFTIYFVLYAPVMQSEQQETNVRAKVPTGVTTEAENIAPGQSEPEAAGIRNESVQLAPSPSPYAEKPGYSSGTVNEPTNPPKVRRNFNGR